MAIVLARPGTPSTRRWPRASSATASRSSSTSCPTMIFLTSYRTLSIGRAGRRGARPVGVVVHSAVLSSVLGQAGGAAGDVDGHGEADADEDTSLVGLMSAATMPMTRPLRSSSGPPELPGLTAASIWMRSWRTGPPSVDWKVRPRPDTTPVLIEPYSPNGLPTTNASLPIWTPPGLPSVAGTTVLGQRVRLEDRDVVVGLAGGDRGRRRRCRRRTSAWIVVASATTWRLVRMSPWSSMMTPLPSPGRWTPLAFGAEASSG